MPTAARLPGRRIAGLTALVLAIASMGSPVTPTRAASWSGGGYGTTAEGQLVALTNRSRAAAGRALLRLDPTLTWIARWRSRDMVQREFFSHSIPPSGRSVFDTLSDRGYCFDLAGENIGWNTYDDEVATEVVHRMFLDSPGHRQNILARDWDVIGVGSFKSPNGRKMWTVLFADRCDPDLPPGQAPTSAAPRRIDIRHTPAIAFDTIVPGLALRPRAT